MSLQLREWKGKSTKCLDRGSSKVVEHLPHHPKVMGSSHAMANATGKETIEGKSTITVGIALS